MIGNLQRRGHVTFTVASGILLLMVLLAACQPGDESVSKSHHTQKQIGVLLVNHGSRSATWRQALLDLETRVSEPIRAGNIVKDVKTAFMEYNEPSIATRMKEFDAAGFTDVIIIPIFLTVSSHSFDDIPTIVCQKEDPGSMETLKVDKIERYKPKAKVWMAPLLDFSDVLRKNVLKRVQSLSDKPADEGLVLIAYGDQTYDKEWSNLLKDIAEHVKTQTGISEYSYGWCGHIANYSPDATTAAIRQVLSVKKTAIVIPVLVALDEMFQVKIIGDGINMIPDAKQSVRYRPDAILPDTNIEEWIVHTACDYAGRASRDEAG